MKLIFPFLLFSCTIFAQNDCNNFLKLIGQRDISETVATFKKNCGAFEEKTAQDGMSKTYISEENGIEIMFVNRAKDKFALPKFEVLSIQLTSFTGSGGFKGPFPFGFTMGMDYKMVKEHILELKSVDFNKKDLGKKSSSFTYTGSPNAALQNRQIKVYISQFDGKNITSMRLRLK